MRAIVTGMIATFPVGGVAWDYGQYALGLERLGLDVYYLEDTGWKSYDPRRRDYGQDWDYGVRFVADSLAALSPTLGERWYVRAPDGRSWGLDDGAVDELVADAALFLNVSGGTPLQPRYLPARRKVLID